MQYSKISSLNDDEFYELLGMGREGYTCILQTLYASQNKTKRINPRFKLSTPERLMFALQFFKNPTSGCSLRKSYKITNDEFSFTIRLALNHLNSHQKIGNENISDDVIKILKMLPQYKKLYNMDADRFIDLVGFPPLQFDKMLDQYFSSLSSLKWSFVHQSYSSLNLEVISTIPENETQPNSRANNLIHLHPININSQDEESPSGAGINLDDLTNAQFEDTIGIPREKFYKMLRILEYHFSKGHNKKLNVTDKLILFLEFVLKNTPHLKLATKYNVSPLTVRNCIKFIDLVFRDYKSLQYPGIWQKGANEQEYLYKIQLFTTSTNKFLFAREGG